MYDTASNVLHKQGHMFSRKQQKKQNKILSSMWLCHHETFQKEATIFAVSKCNLSQRDITPMHVGKVWIPTAYGMCEVKVLTSSDC